MELKWFMAAIILNDLAEEFNHGVTQNITELDGLSCQTLCKLRVSVVKP